MAQNPRLVDMAGSTFGRWTVQEKAGNNARGAALWKCVCACGTVKLVPGGDLRSGKSASCGCAGSRSTLKDRATTHGQTGTKLYHCWKNMLRRCKDKSIKAYGGKGISVCADWSDFTKFYEWAMQSGYQPGLTIERKDNALGYFPDNCTWADRKQQARNRSIVAMADEKTSWAEVAERHGVPPRTMNTRIHAGWSREKAATTPIGAKRPPPERGSNGQFTHGPSHRSSRSARRP